MSRFRPFFLSCLCLLALALLAGPENAWASPGHQHGSYQGFVADPAVQGSGAGADAVHADEAECPQHGPRHEKSGDCPEAFHCSPLGFSLRGTVGLDLPLSARRSPWRVDVARLLRALAPAIDLPPPRLG